MDRNLKNIISMIVLMIYVTIHGLHEVMIMASCDMEEHTYVSHDNHIEKGIL